MSERKALLILHGKQAQNEEVRAAVMALRERGWHLAVRLTWEGEMRRAWCGKRWLPAIPP